jgi:lipoprotein-releasing system permease protein
LIGIPNPDELPFMLTPLPLGLGLRYVRAQKHQFFVSFISWVSLAGICLGVAALITILSILNGFEGELRTRLLALAAHATLPGPAEAGPLRALAARARSESGVERAQPFVEVQGLLSNGPTLAGAVLRGIDAADHEEGSPLRTAMVEGSLDALTAGSGRVALGRALAFQLQVGIGDRVTVLLLRSGPDGELLPRIGSFEVAGLFEIGLADHDSGMAFASLEDVTALAGPAASAGIRVYYDDPFAAPERTRRISARSASKRR